MAVIKKNWRADNPEKSLERDRAYREKNREKRRAACALWRVNNPDARKREDKVRKRATNIAYKKANREKINKQASRRICDRIRTEPLYALGKAVKKKVLAGLDGFARPGRVFDLLGYTPAELKVHLERQFLPGMSWDRGKRSQWHIDHIIPLSSFSPEDVFKAWALSNLRPLWAIDNMKKRAKLEFLL